MRYNVVEEAGEPCYTLPSSIPPLPVAELPVAQGRTKEANAKALAREVCVEGAISTDERNMLQRILSPTALSSYVSLAYT